ncbi:TFC5 [Enterospora canceri]|uniref:TFC5 n=1 Tax=Enterospora canceri TaxID=1081671 RepID=A0A1Y1S4R9_9MICR|nr:TFC5 [Enterospora canceri]
MTGASHKKERGRTTGMEYGDNSNASHETAGDSIKYFCDNRNFKYREKGRGEDELDLITCGTYMKKKNTIKKWTEEETEQFYDALVTCGCDFSLMEMVFKDRNRKNIKDKYVKESRTNPKRIEEALGRHTNKNSR